MFTKTSRQASCLIVLAIGLSLVGGPAWGPAGNETRAEPPKGKESSASKSKRIVYVAKYGSAKQLAALLGKHFKGEAEVEILTDAPSNCLLIRTSPATFAEVVKLLGQLDRRPQLVAVEMLIAEVPPAKGAGGKPGAGKKELDEKKLTGSIPDVAKRVEDLQQKGEIAGLKRIKLTAVEHQPATALIGETRPFVTGVTATRGGKTSRSIAYRSLGTSVKFTARVTPEKKVLIDLDLSESRAFVPEDGIVLGKDETGLVVRATEFPMARVATTLAVPSGQAVFVRGVTKAKAGYPQTLVIVTARLLEADAKAEK
jgi:type II secretory pathway component GspD/PulD (secretin)